MARRGFSLVECLLGLSLFFLAAAAALEAFGTARTVFVRLKGSQESGLAAYAVLEKVRFDLARAGLGLAAAAAWGVVEPVVVSGSAMTLASAEAEFALAGDVAAGGDFIILEEDNEEIKPRREICLLGPEGAEVRTVAAAAAGGIILDSPLERSYDTATGRLILIETVRIFLDADGRTLRRKVNASPAQPLLDDLSSFAPSYDQDANLATVRLTLAAPEEKTYALSLCPKNTLLGRPST
ncbi:MAG: hypothetical protein OEW05_14110 [Candidatus Aminicenantes bacterium]|nr:hypothetical protein [Candidatus Aminicenantes bacterium]